MTSRTLFGQSKNNCRQVKCQITTEEVTVNSSYVIRTIESTTVDMPYVIMTIANGTIDESYIIHTIERVTVDIINVRVIARTHAQLVLI